MGRSSVLLQTCTAQVSAPVQVSCAELFTVWPVPQPWSWPERFRGVTSFVLTFDPHIFQVITRGVKGGWLGSTVWWHHLGWSLKVWVRGKTADFHWPWSRKPGGSSAHREPLYGFTAKTVQLVQSNPSLVHTLQERPLINQLPNIPLMKTFQGTLNTKGQVSMIFTTDIHGSQWMNLDVCSCLPPDLPAGPKIRPSFSFYMQEKSISNAVCRAGYY